MEITLSGGSPFWLDFPVYVLMRVGAHGQLFMEPLALPAELAVMVYTDEDLARRGIANQQLDDMVPVPVANENVLRSVVADFAKRGKATNVAVDVCTQLGKPGGFIVPVSAFGA